MNSKALKSLFTYQLITAKNEFFIKMIFSQRNSMKVNYVFIHERGLKNMMSKRTRRIIALIILTVLFSSLEALMKMLIVIPAIQLLLIDFDEFENTQNERGYKI